MDKLVAGYNELSQEIKTRISELEPKISKLESEKKDTEEGLADIIRSSKELEEIKEDWQKKYDNARLRGTQTEEDYAWSQWEQAKTLLDIASKGKPAAESKLFSIKSSLSSLIKERDSLSKKLGNLSSLSAEAKGETYYQWLLEKQRNAEYENEYTALANKFSDISGYKDCAARAEECRNKIKELKEIEQLDRELNEELKQIDNDNSILLAKPPIFESVIGAIIIIGCIWFAKLIGAIICAILTYFYIQRKKKAEIDKQKSSLRFEYEKKKEEVRKKYQSL
jgi:hypothetical protein